MRPLLPLAVVLVAAGCGSPRDPRLDELYFSGHPVDHWLAQAKAADPKARVAAVQVLGNVGPADPRAFPALAAAAADKDAKVRDAAVLALSKNGPAAASALPAVEKAAQDPDPTVRKHAAAAAARLRGAE